MQKILVLTNNSGGLYSFRKELISALCATKKVVVSTPFGDKVSELEALGCRLVQTEFSRRGMNPVKDLKLLLTYRKILKTERPDVVLTYTIKPNVYGGFLCGLLRIPCIANVTGLGTSIESGGLLSAISTTLYRIGLKHAECVFFQNAENQKLFLRRGIVKGKNRLIPGSGVSLDTHLLEPYPSDDEGIHFLFVGRIMRDKGINELLDAACALHEKRDNTVLDVVGAFEEDYSVQFKSAEEAGWLRYHGPQPNVHPFYRDCHCCVMPSYHEGMSNVLLEASATGRPVIATHVPGCQETFDENVTGLGCEVKNADSLAEAMQRFLETPHERRAQMGIAARQKIEREFDRNIVINAYQEEIDRIIAKQGD